MSYRVYKFGGASVNSDEAIRKVGEIVKNDDGLVIVVSAMGKTTNQLEHLLHSYHSKEDYSEQMAHIKERHLSICKSIFSEELPSVIEAIEKVFSYINSYLEHASEIPKDEVYDQIIPAGELLSSKILSVYLNHIGFNNEWVDARKIILTDNYYRKANVNWEESSKRVKEQLMSTGNIVTQGFIGGGENNRMTTLGREGSDYSAAIFTNLMNATSLTVWKDVRGVLNADPRYFNNPIKLDSISYREAVELSYYGATIIHPNTIKPLQNKNIPLYVKSFNSPTDQGTLISENEDFDHTKPIYIFKPNQVLISLSPKDFSFIDERQISKIYETLYEVKLEVNSMQNSAINFSFCTDMNEERLKKAVSELDKSYRVFYNTNVELLTIRHYIYDQVQQLVQGKEILLEQKTRSTVKFVLRSLSE